MFLEAEIKTTQFVISNLITRAPPEKYKGKKHADIGDWRHLNDLIKYSYIFSAVVHCGVFGRAQMDSVKTQSQ